VNKMVLPPSDVSDDFIDVGEPDAVTPTTTTTVPATPATVDDEPALGFEDLPYSFAKRHGVMLEATADGGVVMVHRPGVEMMAIAEARRKAKQNIITDEVSAEDFDARLTQHYEGDTGGSAEIMDDFGEQMDLADLAHTMPEPEDLLESKDDAPVIKLINAMLSEAVRKQASDIHIEPFEKRLAVRYRVDGVMQKMFDPPRAIAPLMISRLKVMAELNIAERRSPQDGRIALRIAGRPIDIRVSTLPSGDSERVVLRILDKQAGRLDLASLGMPERALQDFEAALSLPHGIILVTGPTGSGKTTSLYAGISKLNTAKHSILTIEDPIEYRIDGIGQTQVNAAVGLDFPVGLRAILRQDPDIVMIGEIRDAETAKIATQATLTGHLVLSTLHTNTAVGSITRLRDMGVEPFLLANTLAGLVAQRLVRRLCEACKKPYTPTEHELKALGVEAEDAQNVFTSHGCAECGHIGFAGRTGVYEMVIVDDKIRQMIGDLAAEIDIEAYARTKSPSIMDDGRRLVLHGITSLEEVLFAVREN